MKIKDMLQKCNFKERELFKVNPLWTSLIVNLSRIRGSLHSFSSDMEADLFVSGNDWTPQVLEPKHKKRKLSTKDPTYDPNSELQGATVDSENEIDASSCAATVLVLASDKCYREEWARVMIWTGSNGWNLEFPDREDWYIFKHRKECIHGNLKAVLAKAVYVPSVWEVPALAKAIPVPIFGEEEWLGKLTDGHCGENSVSLEKFEEITDAFEKTAFCNPDNKINQSWAIVLCSGTGTDTWWMSINIGRKNRSRNDLLS
ncbi:hypothetical protein C5167_007804 [Papaver somniferum]|nr:hypothetical protein C5167_007804 [Papaver somniferum]